ncbi:MAG: hypothetical protein ACTSSH_07765, partial [Candidatus Heimdallarchaeota archaeon]
ELIIIINTQPIIALSAMILSPFFGGLAGFFLIVSAASNMISMYRDLGNGKRIRSLVFKQIFGGVLLLIFAMICEGLTGYGGLAGQFFLNLNDPATTNWQVMLWRWNHFETIHTIAWCLIFNGIIQGLLSLRGNWRNRRQLIISYIIMAVAVVALTKPVWMFVGHIMPGFPFGSPFGYVYPYPYIGTEGFWVIFRAPFVNMLAAPLEPVFPYLAVSFIGSIIGIILSQPKEKINKKFPRNLFLGGLAMFVVGMVGIFVVLILVVIQSENIDIGIENALALYFKFPDHRAWTADNTNFGFAVPLFSWLTQFLAVTGLSIIFIAVLFRTIEFRGISKKFADKTKFIRRFGIVAFTNYNNQWIYFIMWELMSLMFYQTHYQRPLWLGMLVVMILTFGTYSLMLWGWEKIGYILSMEWFIRTIANNIVPLRRQRFPEGTKWWQRGLIDVKRQFYDVEWIDIHDTQMTTKAIVTKAEDTKEMIVKDQTKLDDSKFALTLSLVGMFSIFFVFANIIGLFVSLSARKQEGKNKKNKRALIISSVSIGIFVSIIVTLSILKIGLLGIF